MHNDISVNISQVYHYCLNRSIRLCSDPEGIDLASDLLILGQSLLHAVFGIQLWVLALVNVSVEVRI